MSQRSPATLSGPSLFRQCADCPDSREHWEEFVHRYNPLLVRSVRVAWRRHGPKNRPVTEVAADLLQNVYLAILRNEYRLLQNFLGSTEEEANAYLARTAINETVTYLRAQRALRRGAELISLEAYLEDKERDGGLLPPGLSSRLQRLTEQECLEVLRKCFQGQNANRDILIFWLHFRDGYSTKDISEMGFTSMEVTSINNLLGKMKKELREFLTENVKIEQK